MTCGIGKRKNPEDPVSYILDQTDHQRSAVKTGKADFENNSSEMGRGRLKAFPGP